MGTVSAGAIWEGGCAWEQSVRPLNLEGTSPGGKSLFPREEHGGSFP